MRRLAEGIDANVFVVLAIAFAGLFRVGLLGVNIGSDTWYTLLGGRFVSGSWIPHADTLTIMTRGTQWVDEQWLAHLLLYGTWRLGGWPVALLVLLATYLGAFAVAAAVARRLGASARSTALVSLITLITAMAATGFRAQTLALPLFAAVLWLLLEGDVRPSRRVYWSLPLLVLWANVHGSVVLGAALVSLRGVMLALERPRLTTRSVSLVVLPWLCAVASPYAFELPGYYSRLLHNPTLSRLVPEWQPASVHNQPFFPVLLVAALLLIGRARSSSRFATLVLLATAAAGLLAVRHTVWFALTATALLPRALDDAWKPRPAPRRIRVNLAVAAAAIGAFVFAAGSFAAHDSAWFERAYPARAGDAVAAAAAHDPSATVFANERYADWLLFRHPELAGRVAYDARFELLTQRQLERLGNFRLEQGIGWMSVADGYRLFVLDPAADAGAITQLTRQGGRVLYHDRYVAVLARA